MACASVAHGFLPRRHEVRNVTMSQHSSSTGPYVSPLHSKGHPCPELKPDDEQHCGPNARDKHNHRTKIFVHITTRIWHGVQGAHLPREGNETEWSRPFLSPGNIGSLLLGYLSDRDRRKSRLYLGFLALLLSRRGL